MSLSPRSRHQLPNFQFLQMGLMQFMNHSTNQVARPQRAAGQKRILAANGGIKPIVGGSLLPTKKRKNEFARAEEYAEYKAKRKEKKKKKKDKKKKKKSSWWDSILDVGMKILPHILPFFMSKNPVDKMSYSVHNRRVGGEAPLGTAKPDSFMTSSEPHIEARGDHVLISHTAMMMEPIKKYKLGTSDEATRGDALFTVDLSPQMESWFTQSCMFAQYDIEQVAFTFHPAVPTIEAGQVMGFFEVDPDSRIPLNQADNTIKQAGALTNSTVVDLWSPHSFIFCFHERQWYWTSQSGTENRLQKQGRFSLVATTTMDADLPEILGSLMVSYQARARHAVLSPRPELGLSVHFTNVATTNGTYPFGTVKNLTANGEVYRPATTDTPYAIVPQSLPYAYDVVRPGNVAGSCFRFPAGAYFFTFYTAGTTSGTVENGAYCDGNYQFMKFSPGNADYFVQIHGATSASLDGAFISSGMESGSGLGLICTGYTSITACFLSVVALGGSYPPKNALSAAISSLEARVDRLGLPDGVYIDFVDGSVMRHRLVMSGAGDPVYSLSPGMSPLKVSPGDVLYYPVDGRNEVWQVTDDKGVVYVGDRLGFEYTTEKGCLPVTRKMSFSSFVDKLPSSINVSLANSSDAMTLFRKVWSANRSELISSLLMKVKRPADLYGWISGVIADKDSATVTFTSPCKTGK